LIGEGVVVGDHAAVMGATLASGVHVLRSTYLAGCASMPDATLASYKVQLSLFGREVFLTSAAWLIDAKLKGEVKVEADGELVGVGPFLGCCLGHRVTLGAQVALAAGRAVPNGLTIVGPPEHFLPHVGDFPEGTVLAVRSGRAEPIS
jgi:carbonic anhydrase/acetyltransferase-like protein (isoleucine patch superfamily)